MLEDKIIVIGAPRSGTNMLRDAMCRLDGFATWPCDEINPLWKHGHLGYSYDDLTADSVSTRLSQFMNRKFESMACAQKAPIVVEKTCASSLRVAYLARLLPEARFVFIYRNGLDAVASAVKRWQSPVDLGYTMQKLRFVPPADIPLYGLRFLKNRLRQWSDADRRLHAWGPMTPDIEAAGATGDIEKAAAIQWQQCVDYSLDQFPDGAPAATVCYERFVADPEVEMQRLVTSLGYSRSTTQISQAVADVRPNKAGRGAEWLAGTGRSAELSELMNPAFARLGYTREEAG